MHPDVRENLWLRSSGAGQFLKTYTGYQVGQGSSNTKDYYTALEDSPNPPNPSVGTIKADQSRINFDLEVTEKKHIFTRVGKGHLTQKSM